MNQLRSPLERELTRAKQLHERFGGSCLDVRDIGDLFRKYRELISQTDNLLKSSGVVSGCTRCAMRTGSCCFPGMDEGYGYLLLYVNLLLGWTFPENSGNREGCRFMGKNGCELPARHSFCLNYFCPDLKQSLGERVISEIRATAGAQLLAGWELECALDRWTGARQARR